ncbi:MAG: hypothetical protein JW809_14995 [Pirellulales bacterium]|nr:hypothetical protein [Pirellulales bacterium]
MAIPTIQQGDFHVNGTFTCKAFGGANESIRDEDVSPAADLATGKMRHRFYCKFAQDTPAAITIPIHGVFGATAEIVGVEIFMVTAPAGGDKKVTVDVQAGNIGAGYASVLTAAAEYTTSETDREVISAGIDEPDLADGDSLVVVVTPSGSTGTGGTGLHVTVIVDEKPI